MRTERNLARPLAIFKDNGCDFLEAYQFVYCSQAAGKNKVAIYMNHFILTSQLTISVFSGLGSAGVFVDDGAKAQVQIINLIQAFVFLYIWCLFPAHDRLDDLMLGSQWVLEALMTAILANQGEGESATQAQAAAFALSLLALAIPLFRKFYDGVIVSLIKARRKGPFNKRAAALAFLTFALALQSTIFSLLGIQSTGMTNSLVGKTASLGNREMGGAMTAEILEVGSQLTAEAYAVIFGSDSRSDRHVHAAQTIQKMHRGKMGRALANARLLAELQRRLRAATRIQAALRSKVARRRVEAFAAVKSASWTKADEHFQSRPGMAWVVRQEALIVAKERIHRIRNAKPVSASRLSFPRLKIDPEASLDPDRRTPTKPKMTKPKMSKEPTDLLTESSESDDNNEAAAPSGDIEARLKTGEFHSVAGVVFKKASQHGTSNSLHGAVSASRRDIAISVLPAGLPPKEGDVTMIRAASRAALESAKPLTKPLVNATKPMVNATKPASQFFDRWIRPAALLLLGYAIVGSQTFPQRKTKEEKEEAEQEAEDDEGDADGDAEAEADAEAGDDGGGDGGDGGGGYP